MISYPYGDLGNSGRCPGPALSADPAVRWRFDAGATVSSAPVVADGAVFFMDDDGTLYALDARTGDVAWTWRSDDPGYSTVWVTVAGDLVLVERQESEVLHAIGRADGVRRWTLDDVWYPVALDDLLLAIEVDGLRAVDLASRAERWRVHLDFGLLAARPAVSGGLLVVTGGFEGNHTHGGAAAVDVATGAIRWARGEEHLGGDVREWLTVHPTHAAVVDGLVWIGRDRTRGDTMSSEVAALDPATGADRRVHEPTLDEWEFLLGSVVVGHDVLYVNSESRVLALDPLAGTLRHAVAFAAPVSATPLLAGGVLHVATDDGRLHGVADGTIVWTTTLGDVDWPAYNGDEFSQRETPFTLTGGVAYVRNGASVTAIA